MAWRLEINHYIDTTNPPTEKKIFVFETKAECVAAQDILKYITDWNGGEPIVSSTYSEHYKS